ncbi:GntR family transcriptional regulator [Marinococcus sp. PL1-022]|uniref:GntR family transcriptional regulator n=1 Tax=Marinococcus sp. PL1-022 TaxID=3095363 RepID=UPI0029C27557|nr:GntR family transcriptional regulator [Marinococcus sp. PL1-022]MDX6152250.1 GntR family transcriptional regulator [Marinococcus sp. PL1-022]
MMQQTARSNTYKTIKDKIIKLELKPGERVSENKIAETLEVSRTPVRESFVRLSQEGLIDVYPQRGSFISLIKEEDVEEGRFMREHMEIAVVKLACQNINSTFLQHLSENLLLQDNSISEKNHQRLFQLDEEFHHTIFIGCNKERTWQSVQNMMVHLNRTRMLSLASELNWEKIVTQHKEIVEAIKNQNETEAERIMREHMALVNIDMASLKTNYSNYFE